MTTQLTRKYEGLFIFPPEEAPQAVKEDEKRLEELIRRLGGRLLDRNDLGRRPLGYPVRKHREGRMVLCQFEMETNRLEEFRKGLELDEKILKSAVVKALPAQTHGEGRKQQKASAGAQSEKQEAVRARKPE